MSENDEAYARDMSQQIQEDINRQTGVNEAIARDEERLRIIEAELHKISPRLADNRKYRDLLAKHLPYRIRAHELLCTDMGWPKPMFQWARPHAEQRSVGETTWDNITKHVEQGSPIGDQVAQDTLASSKPITRETEEYLMRPKPKGENE